MQRKCAKCWRLDGCQQAARLQEFGASPRAASTQWPTQATRGGAPGARGGGGDRHRGGDAGASTGTGASTSAPVCRLVRRVQILPRQAMLRWPQQTPPRVRSAKQGARGVVRTTSRRRRAAAALQTGEPPPRLPLGRAQRGRRRGGRGRLQSGLDASPQPAQRWARAPGGRRCGCCAVVTAPTRAVRRGRGCYGRSARRRLSG